MTRRSYHHLSAEERAAIMLLAEQNVTTREIGRRLSRSPSTISRELRRNAVTGRRYDATTASAAYRQRRQRCARRCKLQAGTPLWQYVHDRLIYFAWSPEQIACRLAHMFPDDPDWQISHETIYAAIYAHPKGALKKAMVEALRQHKPQRGQKRRTAAGKGGMVIPEDLRIIHRPEDVAQRELPGHWEGDFIKGAYNRSAVGTVIERKTRFVILCKMTDCSADAALESFTRQMKKVPAFMRESFTYDRGSEMARHEELAQRLKLDIWFADPYAPWQRGSNENTNGLLRQFLPKGTDLSTVSQTQLNDIARLLNGRPRKTLGWQTPEEVMAQEMAKFHESVALDS